MADSSARRIEYEPSKQNGSKKRQRIILDPRKVPYNWVEKTLLIVGSVITLGMMIFLVSSSISATSAQHELTNTQQSVAKKCENFIPGIVIGKALQDHSGNNIDRISMLILNS